MTGDRKEGVAPFFERRKPRLISIRSDRSQANAFQDE